MNFLAPLFLAGAAAVALPVIFHLIRRSSRERVTFSSLMFLFPTPPRLTRWSRIENILLLLLRCVALCLLALGFARPFLPRAVGLGDSGEPSKKVILLVDTSASMRRADLWPDALTRANETLQKLAPGDQCAVFTFDRQLKRLLTFDQWTALNRDERVALAAKRLSDSTPGWSVTHLGAALITAAESFEESVPKEKQGAATGPRQIVLISDFAEGSRLDTLQGYEWPKGVEVIPISLKAKRPTNASLQLIVETEETAAAPSGPRVRVSNASDSRSEQFRIGWAYGADKKVVGAALDVYVPPGQSRVVTAPSVPPGALVDRLILLGDDEDFDNTVYVIPPEAARAKVLFLGADADRDPAQLLYYVKRAFQTTRRQAVEVSAIAPGASLAPADLEKASLIVVADALADGQLDSVRQGLNNGKSVLWVMQTPAAAVGIGAALGVAGVTAEEAPGGGYAMLGEMDFQHPIFAPFADPRYSDFTKIHFWKHRRLPLTGIPGARVLARFDGGDVALIQAPVGQGSLFVLTSGWQPTDSQLALSSKFVPLLYSMLEQTGGLSTQPSQYFVNDPATFPGVGADQPLAVIGPDGAEIPWTAGEQFTKTDLPGIYTVTSHQAPRRFAVNLDPNESKTAPLPLDELEQLGAPIKITALKPTPPAEAKRHLLNSELESRQKLWRWLILGALAVLLIETWVAGSLMRRALPESGV